MLVIVKNDVGFDINTAPTSIFQYIAQVNSPGADYQSFVVTNVAEFCHTIEFALGRTIYQNTNGNIITITSVNPNTVALAQAEVVLNTARTINDLIGQPERCEETDYDDDSDSDEFEMQGPSIVDGCAKKANYDIVPTIIGKHLGGSTSSNSKFLLEKVIQFEKQMSALTALQREIDNLRSDVTKHPIIEKLMTQVVEMNEHPMSYIDCVYFTENNVMIKTKELVTDIEIEGCKRIIGRMEIRISIKSLISTNSEESIVKIFNLDRTCNNNCDDTFQCGHVLNDGHVCWGTAFEPLFKAMCLADLSQIAEIAVRFIRNPNPDDAWAHHLVAWPKVESL